MASVNENRIKSLFGGMKDVKASGNFNSEFERPGTYLEEVLSVELKESQQNRNKLFFKVEKKILQVLEPIDDSFMYCEVQGVDGRPEKIKSHKVGDIVVHMIPTERQTAQGEMKTILAALATSKSGQPIDPAQVDENDLAEACAPDQPLSGARVVCCNKNILTKEKRIFTKISYQIPEKTGEAA